MSRAKSPPAEPVVFVLQSRLGRRGKRTKRDHWLTEAAFVTLAAAEAYQRANAFRYFHGSRIERVALNPTGDRT